MTLAVDDLWPKFRAVLAEGDTAWQPLVTALHPWLLRVAAQQPIGRLRNDKDIPHEIATRVLERLRAKQFSAIGRLCQMEPSPPLAAWLRVLVRNAAIDVMRDQPEFQRATANRDARWISLATIKSTPGEPPDTLKEKRRAVMLFLTTAVERVEALLRDRSADDVIAALALEWKINRVHARRLVQRGNFYRDVIEGVLAGHSYPELAERFASTRREIELTVRYVEEFLAARRFAMPA